jgi:myxalamid-type polyketide synthase MxaB
MSKFEKVFKPKVDGAWNLHHYTADMKLDLFVMFSSVTAMWGTAGQGNYGAANAILDGLARMRRHSGLAATSIQWGPWAEVGMALTSGADLSSIERMGLRPVNISVGLNAMSALFSGVKAEVAVMRPVPKTLVKSLPNAMPHALPFFRAWLAQHSPAAKKAAGPGLAAEVVAMSDGDRREYVQKLVLASVQESMGIVPEADVSLVDQGLDSVAIVEFRNLLQTKLGGSVELALEAIMEDPTVNAITELTMKLMPTEVGAAAATSAVKAPSKDPNRFKDIDAIPEEMYKFEARPEYVGLKQGLAQMETTGKNVFFRPHQSITKNTTMIDGEEVITYSNYNYIGMAGVPFIVDSAKAAIDQYGTTVSASRVAGGEKPLHGELERALSDLLGVEDTIVMLGGHTTNVNTIGHLFGPDDIVLHDAFAHNSIVQGCLLSGSKRLAFPHNDFAALDQMLTGLRLQYNRALIIIEGIYSVDGDIPDLPAFIEVKKKHKALLMVDEAHSIGVLGKRGAGVGEYFGINPHDVDIWMGTLSKAFGSAGGYISGCRSLVEYLKYTSPGFVFSVGMSPPNAAAALASIKLMLKEPERVATCIARGAYFLELAQARGLDTGPSKDTPVVPIIVGNSFQCIRLSQDLMKNHQINVHPMVYPAVPEDGARLRFFITSVHTEEQLRRTADAVVTELTRIRAEDAAAAEAAEERAEHVAADGAPPEKASE